MVMQLGATGMNPLTFGVGGEKKENNACEVGQRKGILY
jgi:hypothetical protein